MVLALLTCKPVMPVSSEPLPLPLPLLPLPLPAQNDFATDIAVGLGISALCVCGSIINSPSECDTKQDAEIKENEEDCLELTAMNTMLVTILIGMVAFACMFKVKPKGEMKENENHTSVPTRNDFSKISADCEKVCN